MTEPRRIAVVNDYPGIIAVLKERWRETGMSLATLDKLVGAPNGFSGKIFGDACVRRLPADLIAPYFEVLALSAHVWTDPEAEEKIKPRWEQRDRADYNANRLAKVGERTINRMLPLIAGELGKRGGHAKFANMTESQIRRHQRRAGKRRWAKKQPKPPRRRRVEQTAAQV